ncbi:MAG: AMIN domain-containing protein [Campylobacter sp.]|nr:AMIN domain-containing protein [Campylobacter sp.]
MKKIWLLFFIAIALNARENPFMPMGELNGSVMTTNIIEQYAQFDKQNIKFPSDMSLLLGITIKYRANDGSIKEKVIQDINKTVDWNDEYVIEKVKNPGSVVAKKLDVSVTMPEQAMPKVAPVVKILDKNDTNQTAKIDVNKTSPIQTPNVVMIDLDTKNADDTKKPAQEVAPNKPIEVKITPSVKPKINVSESSKIVEFMNFVKFDINGQSLKILTTSKNIKHFFYEKNKIVLDFTKPPVSFKTRSLKFDDTVFKNTIIGWHKSYYRVVITLDKKRRYKLDKIEDGYELQVE